MASLTVENYLKAALQISAASGETLVGTGQLAEALHVSPGTVTSMVKTLADSGLAEYRPYEGMKLTLSGKTLALRMLRRHRLIELFLVKTLDLSWDQVHEEAEHMEHAVSDALIDRIDQFLGHPASDPHGDPIPAADGSLRIDPAEVVMLADVPAGGSVEIARVTNQQGDFLRYLAEAGLTLGTAVTVLQKSPEAGVLSLELCGRTMTLGIPAAQQILVTRR